MLAPPRSTISAAATATATALLVSTLLLPTALAALTPERRGAAFVGYSEQQHRGSKQEQPEAAAASQGEPCPVDERPGDCPGWAARGECLSNPLFMRSACKASCQVVARCTRGMTGSASTASASDAPWAGHATPAGTAVWAAHSERASRGLFRSHSVHYSGDPRSSTPLCCTFLVSKGPHGSALILHMLNAPACRVCPSSAAAAPGRFPPARRPNVQASTAHQAASL